MVEVAPIEEILIHIDPDLDYGPDWMPEPAPPVDIPILTAHGSWSDVFDWVKSHAILPSGTPIADEFASPALVQEMINAGMGETIKALSGFMNRQAAMTVEAASLLEDAITNEASAELFDFSQLSQRLDRIQNVQDFVVGTVIPTLFAQFDTERATMLRTVAAGDELTRQWATNTILAPLIESLGRLDHDLRQVIDLKTQEATQISQTQVDRLGAQLMPAIASAAAAAAANATWIDDCGAPMCETVGPKTDLGKLLKALKIAAAAATLVELAALDKNGIEGVLEKIANYAGRVVDTFDSLFVGGGQTLGETIGATGAG